MNLQYLIKYKSFSSVEDMDTAVEQHIYHNADQLPTNYRNILKMLASYSLNSLGTSHLRYDTIAEEVGCSKTTVVRAMKRLKELGIIEVTKGTKKNGIQGADYFHILHFSNEVAMRMKTREVVTREKHTKPTASKVEHTKKQTESLNSFKASFNPSVDKNVNAYSAHAIHSDVKEQLRAIYNPSTVEDNQAFEELCKIAFGRIKQYMQSHNVPYLQLEQIILKCMSDLVRKKDVRNQFAMYSKMIERQTLQLFETFLQPKMAAGINMYGKKVGVVPDWFVPVGERGRKENVRKEQAEPEMDFEAERKKMLARLGR